MLALHSTRACNLTRQHRRASHVKASQYSDKLPLHQTSTTAEPSSVSHTTLALATLARRSVLAATGVLLSSALLQPVADASVTSTTKAGENVGFLSNEEVDRDRAAHRMKRAFDGRVAVQGKKDKRWYDLKVEPQMPGLIYFRRDDGPVYYVAYGSLSQCDLADDDMVGALSDDDWETALQEIQFAGEKPGDTEKLELTREGFYAIPSLLGPGDEQQ